MLKSPLGPCRFSTSILTMPFSMRCTFPVLLSDTKTAPFLLTVTSFKKTDPSTGILLMIVAFFISITTSSVKSATYSSCLYLAIPLGAFNPVTHSKLTGEPVFDNLLMLPLPSLPLEAPSIFETHKQFSLSSTSTDSGIFKMVSVAHNF